MSKERDSKKRVALVRPLEDVSAFAEVAVPEEIQVVPTGTWNHPVYGEMEITPVDIAEFVKNFKGKVRLDIPITQGHDNGMSGGELPAIAWFKDLVDRGVNGLWGAVEWTDEGKQLLQQKSFKYFSPEFYEQYADPESGEKYGHVHVGGALTNKPYFKELEPVVAFSEPVIMSQFSQSMNLKTILAKKVEDLSADEKTFVRKHKEQLSAEQQSAFKSVFDEPEQETDEEKAAREAKEKEEKEAAEKAEADKKAEEERQAAEKKGKIITMSEAEVTALKKAADDGAKALQKIEASEREAVVTKMIFSQSNMDGRFLPKQKGALVDFVKALSEKQRDQFVNIVNNMPKMDAKLFTEIGDGGDSGAGLSGIAKQVDEGVKAIIKASEGKTVYSVALKQLFTEKPELKERYDAALTEGGAN